MMKAIIKAESVNKPNPENITRFAETIRKFFRNPENIKAFEEWKKAGAV